MIRGGKIRISYSKTDRFSVWIYKLFLLTKVFVKQVGKTVAGILHLLIYQLCREFNCVIFQNRCVVWIPLVDNLIIVTNLVYPVVKVALDNLLNLTLLKYIKLLGNLVVLLALVN